MALVDIILGILGVVIPPDPAVTAFVSPGDPRFAEAEKAMKELRSWRWRVSGLLFASAAAITWVVFAAQYVNAEEVNRKIRVALEPIQKKLDESIRSQGDLAEAVNDQLAVSTADNICRLVVRQDREDDIFEKNVLRKEIDAQQQKYMHYTGIMKDYPETRCRVK